MAIEGFTADDLRFVGGSTCKAIFDGHWGNRKVQAKVKKKKDRVTGKCQTGFLVIISVDDSQKCQVPVLTEKKRAACYSFAKTLCTMLCNNTIKDIEELKICRHGADELL